MSAKQQVNASELGPEHESTPAWHWHEMPSTHERHPRILDPDLVRAKQKPWTGCERIWTQTDRNGSSGCPQWMKPLAPLPFVSIFLVFDTLQLIVWPDCISYTILAPAIAKKEEDPKKGCQGVLEAVQLDTELYRLGSTKACGPPLPFFCCCCCCLLEQSYILFGVWSSLWRAVFLLYIFIPEKLSSGLLDGLVVVDFKATVGYGKVS